MIELIKNPLYPKFSDREIVAIEDDCSIHFTDEEMEKAIRYLEQGFSIIDDWGPILGGCLGEYMNKHPETINKREGHSPVIYWESIPTRICIGGRVRHTFEVYLRYKNVGTCSNL